MLLQGAVMERLASESAHEKCCFPGQERRGLDPPTSSQGSPSPCCHERVEASVMSAFLRSVGTGCVSVVGCLPTVYKTLNSSTEKKGRGGGVRREGEEQAQSSEDKTQR